MHGSDSPSAAMPGHFRRMVAEGEAVPCVSDV